MKLKKISCGKLETNSYVLYDDKNAIVIDAPDGIYRVESFLRENNLNIVAVLLTHGHFDHIAGARRLQELGAKIYLHKADEFKIADIDHMAMMLNVDVQNFEVDYKIEKEENIKINDVEIKIIFTPGHTKGGVSYIIDNCLFSGDTMFRDSFGRVDFFDSNPSDLKESLLKLYELDESLIVYPGHGEESTIKREKVNNLVRYVY